MAFPGVGARGRSHRSIGSRIAQHRKGNTMTSDDASTITTMRAIVQDTYGSADVLRLGRIARPRIASDVILVHVHAAGLDRGTWHLMAGRPYLMRILGFGFRAPKNPVAGLDVAGTVAAVGSAVTRFHERRRGVRDLARLLRRVRRRPRGQALRQTRQPRVRPGRCRRLQTGCRGGGPPRRWPPA